MNDAEKIGSGLSLILYYFAVNNVRQEHQW